MSINTSGINSVLSQIRQLQAQQDQAATAASGIQGTQGAEKGQFGELLANAIQSVNEDKLNAASVSQAFASGQPGTELADVMLSLNQAQVSFKAMAEVRNRLVSSYQDIMNMPI